MMQEPVIPKAYTPGPPAGRVIVLLAFLSATCLFARPLMASPLPPDIPADIKANHLLPPQEAKVSKAFQKQLDHGQHMAHLERAAESAPPAATSKITIPNLTLTNELGRQVALMDDLIRDKIVVINTIYTRCTTVCPVMGMQYSRLQHVLTRRYGKEKILKDVLLLSVSIDPVNDKPRQLRAFKNKFKGGDGWSLLTGSSADIDKLLKATGLFTPDLTEHSPITLIGRVSQNSWTRISGLGSPQPIAKVVDKLLHTPPPLAVSQISLDDANTQE